MATESKMKVKIALVQPSLPDKNYLPNLGILYIASVLERDGFEVAFFDENYCTSIVDKIVAYEPALVGFTVVTAAMNRVCHHATKLKSKLDNVVIAIGGPHVHACPMESIQNSEIDFAIIGEGEQPLLQLARCHRDGNARHEVFVNIENLLFIHQKKLYRTPTRPFLDSAELDELPYPAFHLLDLDKVFKNVAHGLYSTGKRILPIMTSRGCPHECTFCCRTMGKKVRFRSMENVLNEIDTMVDDYQIDELYFEDDNFTVNKKRAKQILTAVRQRHPRLNIKFANGLRADKVDKELLLEIKSAGAYWVGFGVESGSPRVLNLMKKKLDLDAAMKNIKLASELGLKTGANFIIGYPGETLRDVLTSIRYFKSLDLDSIAIVNLVPFPGTEAHRVCEANGYLTSVAKNYDNYYFGIVKIKTLIRTPHLSPFMLRALVSYAYFTFYILSWKRFKKIAPMAWRRLFPPKKS